MNELNRFSQISRSPMALINEYNYTKNALAMLAWSRKRAMQ